MKGREEGLREQGIRGSRGEVPNPIAGLRIPEWRQSR